MPALPVPFADHPLAVVLGLNLVYAAAFYLRGAFGFGSNMPIVLLTAWVLGAHHAVLLVVVVATLAQVHLLPQGFESAHWKVTWPVITAMTAGSVGGVWLLTVLSGEWLTVVLGLVVIIIVALDAGRVLERLARRYDVRAPAWSGSMALASGALGTVAGGGGIYLLAPYLKLALPDARVFRGTSIMLSGLSMLARIVMVALAGLLTFEIVVEALALMPAVLLGTWGGTRRFRRGSQAGFFRALRILLLAAALALVLKGLTGLD